MFYVSALSIIDCLIYFASGPKRLYDLVVSLKKFTSNLHKHRICSNVEHIVDI
jgi:hypothetical protein